MTVYKEHLEVGEQEFILPVDAKILSVGNQQGIPVMWYSFESDEHKTIKKVFLAMTGQKIPPNYTSFVGTILLDGGLFVVHLFQE